MFHKEGFKIILITFILTVGLSIAAEQSIDVFYLKKGIQIVALIFLILVLQFFRNPKRDTKIDYNKVLASVDGKVVIVEKVFEKEYFKDERIQVSIFMSPLNVHVTRYPISGKVLFSKYHPGKYLVAWHPKSSELNERTTIVVESPSYGKILFRQIAGALARRIINYAKEGDIVTQGTDSGFIKFGSRVDIYLPLTANINVIVGQKVKGGETIIAS